MLNIVSITIFLLSLLFIEDCIYKSDTLFAKTLSVIITFSLVAWVIAFIVLPVANFLHEYLFQF